MAEKKKMGRTLKFDSWPKRLQLFACAGDLCAVVYILTVSVKNRTEANVDITLSPGSNAITKSIFKLVR